MPCDLNSHTSWCRGVVMDSHGSRKGALEMKSPCLRIPGGFPKLWVQLFGWSYNKDYSMLGFNL